MDNFYTKTKNDDNKEICKWNLISRNVLKTCKGTASIGEAKLFTICPDCGRKIELVSNKYDEETTNFLIKYEKAWVLLQKCNDCGLYYLPKLGHNCKR